MSDSKIESHEDNLHGTRAPSYNIEHEKWEHRTMCFLKAQGHSIKEIAEQTGFTPVAVSNILRQPWALARIREEITKAGRNEVEELLKGSVADAVQRLITEMANPDARSSERTTAADKLLDRVFGKPNQPMTHHSSVDLNQLSDDQLAKLIPTDTSRTGTS